MAAQLEELRTSGLDNAPHPWHAWWLCSSKVFLLSEFSLQHVLLLVHICAFTKPESSWSEQIQAPSCCKHFPNGLFPVQGLSGGHSPSQVTALGCNFINYFLKCTALTVCKIPADCPSGSFSTLPGWQI